MRSVAALLFATVLLAPTLAMAQAAPHKLPNASIPQTGSAATFGLFLCGLPGSTIDAFKVKVDQLVPGATTSSAFAQGAATARAQIDAVRANGDDRELKSVTCTTTQSLIQRVIDAPVPSAGKGAEVSKTPTQDRP